MKLKNFNVIIWGLLLQSFLLFGCSSPSKETPDPTPIPTPTPTPTPMPEPISDANLGKWIKLSYKNNPNDNLVYTFEYDDRKRVITLGEENEDGWYLASFKIDYTGSKIPLKEASFRPGQLMKLTLNLAHNYTFPSISTKEEAGREYSIRETFYKENSAKTDGNGKIISFATTIKQGTQPVTKNDWSYNVLAGGNKEYKLTWNEGNLTKLEIATTMTLNGKDKENKLETTEVIELTYTKERNNSNISILGMIAPVLGDHLLTYQNLLSGSGMHSKQLPSVIKYSGTSNLTPPATKTYTIKYTNIDKTRSIPIAFELYSDKALEAQYSIRY